MSTGERRPVPPRGQASQVRPRVGQAMLEESAALGTRAAGGPNAWTLNVREADVAAELTLEARTRSCAAALGMALVRFERDLVRLVGQRVVPVRDRQAVDATERCELARCALHPAGEVSAKNSPGRSRSTLASWWSGGIAGRRRPKFRVPRRSAHAHAGGCGGSAMNTLVAAIAKLAARQGPRGHTSSWGSFLRD